MTVHWRDCVLATGQGALNSRPAEGEIQCLPAKIGEMTMANELLLERCRTAEAGLPFGAAAESMSQAPSPSPTYYC